jgi:hypothetical protein
MPKPLEKHLLGRLRRSGMMITKMELGERVVEGER